MITIPTRLQLRFFLVIDEESIDNGNEPNNFSESDPDDNLAEIGLRQTLRFFRDNIGAEIVLYTGQVGDEGWFALKTIPVSWESAGPTGRKWFKKFPTCRTWFDGE